MTQPVKTKDEEIMLKAVKKLDEGHFSGKIITANFNRNYGSRKTTDSSERKRQPKIQYLGKISFRIGEIKTNSDRHDTQIHAHIPGGGRK